MAGTRENPIGSKGSWSEQENINALLRGIQMELQAELNLCAMYLTYRVERDLYEVILDEEISEDLTWEALRSVLK